MVSKGGMELEESLQVAKRLEGSGVHALVLSGGFVSRAPMYVMRGEMPHPKHESLHEMLVAQIWRSTGWQMDDSNCAFPRSLLSGRCTEIPESPPYAFGLRRRFSVAAKNR